MPYVCAIKGEGSGTKATGGNGKKKQPTMSEADLRALFEKVDASSSGSITVAELIQQKDLIQAQVGTALLL